MFKKYEMENFLSNIEEFVKRKDNTFFINKEFINGTEIWNINYKLLNPSQWKIPLARELRGLKYIPKTGEWFLSIHKFFGHKENQFTQTIGENLEIYEKLDGSLVIPVVLDYEEVYFGTKTTFKNDISSYVNKILQKNRNIKEMILDLYKTGYIPLFEYISPNNRIVIPYSEEKLVLIQIRNLFNGEYLDYEEMERIAKQYGLSTPQRQKTDYKTLMKLKQTLKNQEGFVVKDIEKFEKGDYELFQKFKTEWYLQVHKIYNSLNEKNIVENILNNTLDEILSLVQDEAKKREILKTASLFTQRYNEILDIIEKYKEISENMVKKEYFKKYGKDPLAHVALMQKQEEGIKNFIRRNTRNLKKTKEFLNTPLKIG